MALDHAPGAAASDAPFGTAPAPDSAPAPAPPTTPEAGAEPTTPEGSAVPPGASDGTTATPSPGAPQPSPAPPQELVQEYQTLQQNVQYVGWLEQQLQAQAAQDQASYNAARTYAPVDQHEALQAEYRAKEAERQAAFAQIGAARKEAQLAEQALQLKYARHLMEAPSRQVLEHQHLSRAVQALPQLPAQQVEQELRQYLGKIDHPPSFAWATEQYIDLRRKAVAADRAESGIDQMGGTASSTSGRRTSSHEDFIAALKAGA